MSTWSKAWVPGKGKGCPWWRGAGRLPGQGWWMVAACVVLTMCGCSRYDITLRCEPRINSFGLSDPESAGRLLKVALVCLTESDLRKLSKAEGLRGKMDWKEDDAWTWITAEDWFTRGLDKKVERVVKTAGAIETCVLKGGQTLKVRVTHRDPFGKRAGILALADFSGMTPDTEAQFESAVWMPTRWKGHRFTLEVGETVIHWASED